MLLSCFCCLAIPELAAVAVAVHRLLAAVLLEAAQGRPVVYIAAPDCSLLKTLIHSRDSGKCFLIHSDTWNHHNQDILLFHSYAHGFDNEGQLLVGLFDLMGVSALNSLIEFEN